MVTNITISYISLQFTVKPVVLQLSMVGYTQGGVNPSPPPHIETFLVMVVKFVTNISGDGKRERVKARNKIFLGNQFTNFSPSALPTLLYLKRNSWLPPDWHPFPILYKCVVTS